ncbi:MAG: metallophosphoesterase [Alphaproteobacteria bacterium]|nr:metallophosphoesterase [Alphaproteobacteria bacterium]
MPDGAVLSDLHLFSRRSEGTKVENALCSYGDDLSFLVLNGDILDFRWSTFETEENTIKAGISWLQALGERFPDCHVYYVMGNHDCTAGWGEALDRLSSERFSWSPTHFILGDSLFLHGDLPLEGKEPFHRPLQQEHRRMPAYGAMDLLYHGLIKARAHKIPCSLFSGSYCAPKILNNLRLHEPDILPGLQHIYFGHTHSPFRGHMHEGIAFHNTGSAVRYMDFNSMSVAVRDV